MNISRKTNKSYWQGQGRKLIVLPTETLQSSVLKNELHKQLYVTDLGFYPAAKDHYTFRETGCSEMVLIICVSGKGSYETKFVTTSVSPGQFFILPPNEQHRYESDNSDPWSIYWIRIGGSHLQEFCKNPLVTLCFKPSYTNRLIEICKVFDDIYASLAKGYSHKNIAYANMCLQYLLASLIYEHREHPKEMSMPEKVILFMKAHLDEHYSLKELASKFCYSTSQFSKIFRLETGYAPIDYFIHLKVQHCCQMLDLTSKKIYEVAEAVGYDDVFYFSRLFKKVMQVSPNQYRLLKKG
ncbi:AraC family transcriptional regulator [Niabella insulamsoli]|uniref:AraC family transcriptional regulator n=1 Tax=Niabella insulamsoli TaxID=3144874 RepID=UPI0031FD8EE8